MDNRNRILLNNNDEEQSNVLCEEVCNVANATINRNGVFRVGLSGGSMINYLVKGLPKQTSDWSKWEFYFCDERIVPIDSDDSTYGLYKKQLLPVLGLNESQFVIPNVTDLNDVESIAKDYEREIVRRFGMADGTPQFDLLLLGMGPDGHTCSLFPNHELLEEKTRLIAAITDSPKPPPKRITMTPVLIKAARNIIVSISDSSDMGKIMKIILTDDPLPIKQVLPPIEVSWVLNKRTESVVQKIVPRADNNE